MAKRITKLTPEQEARFDEWADKWIEIGLRTGPADRPRFEAAVRECYRYAKLEPPRVIVWVPSPLVVALAAPIASYLLATRAGRRDAVGDAVRDAVRGAVGGAVEGAVRDAVEGAVRDAVEGAVRGAVEGAVEDAVGGAVEDAVEDAVGGAVRGAVGGARREIADAISRAWPHYMGGQLWVGGWYWGGSWTSFFREVCHLELMGDLWDRARAYEATMESACWWWPHRDFVMVSEHPTVIHRELVDPARPRGWNSHRLHCDDGPAVAWPDGWGVWAIHGTRVPRQVVEAPHTLTVEQIRDERNAEVRRVMLERFGAENYMRLCGATKVAVDDWGTLWRADLAGDEPLVMAEMLNSTPEPDGHSKTYWTRVPERGGPNWKTGRDQPPIKTPLQAIAWSYGETADQYAQLKVQT